MLTMPAVASASAAVDSSEMKRTAAAAEAVVAVEAVAAAGIGWSNYWGASVYSPGCNFAAHKSVAVHN